MKRRKFINTSAKGLLGLGLSAAVYSWQVEPFWLEFVERPLAIEHLPNKRIGARLMQISDMHVGDAFDLQYLIDSFKKAKKFKPDFVVYTGDFITYDSEKQLEQLQEVLQYAVKGKLGTLSILGNHDYGLGWSDTTVANQVVKALESQQIQVLRNSELELSGLNFIGFDDYWSPKFDPSVMSNHFDSSKANIVLCHNPDVCDLDIWNGYQGWILAGHTHGGQVKPPFLPPPLLPVQNKQFTSGAFDLHDGRQLYINRALGHLHQIRFNVRPEITLFTLSKS